MYTHLCGDNGHVHLLLMGQHQIIENSGHSGHSCKSVLISQGLCVCCMRVCIYFVYVRLCNVCACMCVYVCAYVQASRFKSRPEGARVCRGVLLCESVGANVCLKL